jgi:hypothetical protein
MWSGRAVFWNSGRKQRRNHVKLVMQNILAGQEMMTISLAFIQNDKEAHEVMEATKGLLAHSRKLMTGLCEKNTKLSEHNAAEQLRVNEAYRSQYKTARAASPNLLPLDFSDSFRPSSGWRSFEADFEKSSLEEVKKQDPFWE